MISNHDWTGERLHDGEMKQCCANCKTFFTVGNNFTNCPMTDTPATVETKVDEVKRRRAARRVSVESWAASQAKWTPEPIHRVCYLDGFDDGYKALALAHAALARSHRDLQERYDKAVKALEHYANEFSWNLLGGSGLYLVYSKGTDPTKVAREALADIRREETKK